MELFNNIKCCSDTEDVSNKVRNRVPLPWHSAEFSTLARQLDKIQIHKSSNTKGQQFVKKYILEHRRKSSNPSSSAAPLNLPINCYAPEYLATLSKLHIKILNPKPAIDFSKLLLLTKVSSQPEIQQKLWVDR
ncbi:hypothetical protein PSTG_14920 [Puccinia striiformis f. sp. tritici PST-78]|uniref:Uncharacterized protein n=1 Tax=Puccinia striiformis f. sp. tritici PST-78 TaxID=1165861 RepID=A0A0L0UX86_9BASI|nr:hypothetical protein PSTG_14920 [Puccinia striiformis f. sp. tritici PST-78]